MFIGLGSVGWGFGGCRFRSRLPPSSVFRHSPLFSRPHHPFVGMASFHASSDASGPIIPTSQLEVMASSMGVPRPFIAWLSEQGLSTPEELALVCSKESEIETSLLGASGVTFEKLIDRVSVTRLWLQARSRVDRTVGLQSGKITEDPDDKLDEATTNDIYSRWMHRHNFKPTVGRVLADTLFARRYKELNATPRRLSIILLDQIRTGASLERRGAKMDAESLEGHDDLWNRMRADFTSMSLVTIREPSFLSFSAMEAFVDRLRGWLFQRFETRLAPMQFYMDAHAKMMTVFIEGIRTDGKTLEDLTADTSSYQHFWTVYTPSSSGSSRGGPPAAGATADIARELRREIDDLKNKAKRQQADCDRKLAQVRSANESRGSRDGQGDRRYRSRSRPADRPGNGNGNGNRDNKGNKGGKGKGKDRRR